MKKEMNFIEAVNFKREHPEIKIMREDDDIYELSVESSGIQYINIINFSVLDVTTIVDLQSKWIAEIPDTERTHTEIMSNWFFRGNLWRKVTAYDSAKKQYYLYTWRSKESFGNLAMKTQEEMESME